MEDEFRFSERVILPNVHFVHTVSSSKDMNARLWDNISLTGLEQHVVDALRIIEPQIENLAFLEEPEVSLFSGRTRRVPYVSLRNGNNRYPLSIMGDGMNHILSIILAIVNSKNGICLIDEIENGIYYRKHLENHIFPGRSIECPAFRDNAQFGLCPKFFIYSGKWGDEPIDPSGKTEERAFRYLLCP